MVSIGYFSDCNAFTDGIRMKKDLSGDAGKEIWMRISYYSLFKRRYKKVVDILSV